MSCSQKRRLGRRCWRRRRDQTGVQHLRHGPRPRWRTATGSAVEGTMVHCKPGDRCWSVARHCERGARGVMPDGWYSAVLPCYGSAPPHSPVFSTQPLGTRSGGPHRSQRIAQRPLDTHTRHVGRDQVNHVFVQSSPLGFAASRELRQPTITNVFIPTRMILSKTKLRIRIALETRNTLLPESEMSGFVG